MNRLKKSFFLLAGFFCVASSYAQDTLPKFSVKNIGNNRIIVGWVNELENIRQISIQRSHDSLKNYKTILTVADPRAVQNGFADTKAPNDHMFYRLFYAVEGGAFYFTEAKKPILDTSSKNMVIVPPPKEPVIKKPEGFVPSFYVYTNKEGYVFINLPDALKENYHLKFFEENDAFLFEIKGIKDKALTLDKANFYKGGWYKFELYNDEKLVERHKFYLAKDF